MIPYILNFKTSQNMPTFTPDDTLTVTFDAEVEFRKINYPIKAINNIGWIQI